MTLRMPQIVSGIITLLVSGILGVLVIHTGFVLFQHLTGRIHEREELERNNIAVGILCAAYILSLGIILKTALQPVMQTFFLMVYGDQFAPLEIFQAAGIMLVQLVLSLVIAVLSLLMGLWIFGRLTRGIDEFAEIARNNIAVAIVQAAVLIVFALFLEQGVARLLHTIVPAPPIQSETLRLPG